MRTRAAAECASLSRAAARSGPTSARCAGRPHTRITDHGSRDAVITNQNIQPWSPTYPSACSHLFVRLCLCARACARVCICVRACVRACPLVRVPASEFCARAHVRLLYTCRPACRPRPCSSPPPPSHTGRAGAARRARGHRLLQPHARDRARDAHAHPRTFTHKRARTHALKHIHTQMLTHAHARKRARARILQEHA